MTPIFIKHFYFCLILSNLKIKMLNCTFIWITDHLRDACSITPHWLAESQLLIFNQLPQVTLQIKSKYCPEYNDSLPYGVYVIVSSTRLGPISWLLRTSLDICALLLFLLSAKSRKSMKNLQKCSKVFLRLAN